LCANTAVSKLTVSKITAQVVKMQQTKYVQGEARRHAREGFRTLRTNYRFLSVLKKKNVSHS
jgi:hypothetical protein